MTDIVSNGDQGFLAQCPFYPRFHNLRFLPRPNKPRELENNALDTLAAGVFDSLTQLNELYVGYRNRCRGAVVDKGALRR